MALLEKISDDLWLCEGGTVDFFGFPYPTRSVVVRLTNGDLWVWSPVRLTPALKAEVDTLGPVKHLVSPNKIHHLYLQEWQDAFADAKLWGPASTLRKRGDLTFEPALNDEAPAAWRGEIDQAWFRGSFAMDEMVFFHRASRTAILADLSENFSAAFMMSHWKPWQRAIARIWKITEGQGFAPLEWRLSFWRRSLARRALQKLLSWAPERVIMAHGEWQRSDGSTYLRRAFSWLG